MPSKTVTYEMEFKNNGRLCSHDCEALQEQYSSQLDRDWYCLVYRAYLMEETDNNWNPIILRCQKCKKEFPNDNNQNSIL
jgi:hypothetical protein